MKRRASLRNEKTVDRPMLHGHSNQQAVQLASCACGKRMLFDTDAIGRSVARCVGCGATLPLARLAPENR